MRGADADPVEVDQILRGFSGKLAFDVGGNIGRTASVLAESFDRVVSFEPAEESYRELAALDIPNIETYQLAVSGHNGAVPLIVQEHPIKTGQLTSGVCEHWGKIVAHRTVPCVTINRLVDKHGIPDLIKIDVEGHELEVIQGALVTLAASHPNLYIEVHSRRLGDGIAELIGGWYPELQEIRHPHYRPGNWGFDNHYWLIAEEKNGD